MFTTSIWLFIKPLLKKEQTLEKLNFDHYKFKNNFEVFNVLHQQSKKIDINIEGAEEIVLGSKDALITMTLVTSPACFYCKRVHRDLEKILSQHADKIQLTLRFNVPIKNESLAYRIANKLMEIYHHQARLVFLKALNEAYKNDMNPRQWLSQWGQPDLGLHGSLLLQKQKEWAQFNDVNFTPALFINGREFPSAYDKKDLSYFIDELQDRLEAEKISPVYEALV